MEEEEHEVYGGEIPDEGEMEGDMDSHHADVDMAAVDDDAVKVSPISFVLRFSVAWFWILSKNPSDWFDSRCIKFFRTLSYSIIRFVCVCDGAGAG